MNIKAIKDISLKATNNVRLRLVIRGAVQGVGFRPFVYRLATEMNIHGWVNNSPQGVLIEVEGNTERLREFISRLESEKPALSSIQSLEQSYLDPVGYSNFEVRASDRNGEKSALVLPDIATCPECLKEIFDPGNRRYLYPFTNCTNCGPRFTIIEALPYDRANTTMKKFPMCPECQAEYDNPSDRRFHAQPNACPDCGPHLELRDTKGITIENHHKALLAACEAIRDGRIVAVKGIGGFHILVDPRNENAVVRLRERKWREEKPLALMFPSLEMVRATCHVSDIEERLLVSPEAPIVILKRKGSAEIASSVAPRNPYLGIMLPYSPLHHLLLAELGFPVVATSGNHTNEPIATDERDALERLSGIADLFLIHNRPIVRHADDSIVREMGGREMVLRRARGFAPLPVFLSEEVARVLAVGAHLKNAIALSRGREAIISQHIGDLETSEALGAFKSSIEDLENLHEIKPEIIACDLHPDYLSTKYARGKGLSIIAVQHHHAHILSAMAENELSGEVLGVSWDGTGFGIDKTIWGGEFLKTKEATFERFGHLRHFMLPGGERAIIEPRRVALGLLYEIYGDELFGMPDLAPVTAFSTTEIKIIQGMLSDRINSPLTTSAGRLFDAVSSIVGIRQVTHFEGQAAMELEFVLHGLEVGEAYPFGISKTDDTYIIDWEQSVRRLIEDLRKNVGVGIISARFHNTMTEMIIEIARFSRLKRVVLSGGCFQNKYLAERTIEHLREAGFHPYWHQRVPPNDGGIALGQIVAAANRTKR